MWGHEGSLLWEDSIGSRSATLPCQHDPNLLGSVTSPGETVTFHNLGAWRGPHTPHLADEVWEENRREASEKRNHSWGCPYPMLLCLECGSSATDPGAVAAFPDTWGAPDAREPLNYHQLLNTSGFLVRGEKYTLTHLSHRYQASCFLQLRAFLSQPIQCRLLVSPFFSFDSLSFFFSLTRGMCMYVRVCACVCAYVCMHLRACFFLTFNNTFSYFWEMGK